MRITHRRAQEMKMQLLPLRPFACLPLKFEYKKKATMNETFSYIIPWRDLNGQRPLENIVFFFILFFFLLFWDKIIRMCVRAIVSYNCLQVHYTIGFPSSNAACLFR